MENPKSEILNSKKAKLFFVSQIQIPKTKNKDEK
jgi:hypothetical protein